MTASWEDARRCPFETCQQVGVERSRSRLGPTSFAPGSTLVTLRCANSRCAYHETTWVVQIRPDGTIPDPTLEREKKYTIDPKRLQAAGQRYMEHLQQQVERETQQGETYEVQSPWAPG